VSLHLSTPELITGLVLAVVWGFLGYRLSERARRTYGRTPWGMPSLLWAFFWFCSLLLGLALYGIYLLTRASAQRKGAHPQAWSQPPVPSGPPVPAPVAARHQPNPGSNFPAYPRPANSGPITGSGDDVAQTPVAPAPPRPEPSVDTPGAVAVPPDAAPAPASGTSDPTLSPPAWHPDPSGRFHYRWWDGNQWTSQVSVDGQHQIDTSPDQRIGPYGV
jgi:hypothetical protein